MGALDSIGDVGACGTDGKGGGGGGGCGVGEAVIIFLKLIPLLMHWHRSYLNKRCKLSQINYYEFLASSKVQTIHRIFYKYLHPFVVDAVGGGDNKPPCTVDMLWTLSDFGRGESNVPDVALPNWSEFCCLNLDCLCSSFCWN